MDEAVLGLMVMVRYGICRAWSVLVRYRLYCPAIDLCSSKPGLGWDRVRHRPVFLNTVRPRSVTCAGKVLTRFHSQL